MNLLDKKKLNLLLHLAKIDGKFERSERDLLMAFIKEKGLTPDILKAEDSSFRLSDFENAENKVELLYWALKMMHADEIIHDKEILFCKNLAMKLGFNPNIITYFSGISIPDYELFKQKVREF